MGRLELKNLKVFADGRVYFRRKVGGKDTYIRLPSVDDPSFSSEYARLSKPDTDTAKPLKGTIGDLVATYRASSAYLVEIKPKTRENYARYLDIIAVEHGHRTVKGLTRAHVVKMRDKFMDTPGKANNWLSIFRMLIAYAIDPLGIRDDNPAAGVGKLEIDEHAIWPDELLIACLEVATPMTRLAIIQGACSGLRISDSVRVRHGHFPDRKILTMKTGKKDKEVAIPMHPIWLQEIDKLPPRSPTVLYDRDSKPFTTGALQGRIRDLMKHEHVASVIKDLAAREAIPEGETFSHHGLRKNACCFLLEQGLSDATVGAILAMSPEMVAHYGKKVILRRIAEAAAYAVTSGSVLPTAKPADTH